MTEATTIRGLERGLQVFRVLQQAQSLSLKEVHAATRLPKPSLLRILATLEQAGMVQRRLDDGRYRVSAKLIGGARKPGRYEYVVEAAAPVLNRLCQRIIWPSDLAVPAGNHMEIIETSRALSPFVLNSARIGNRVNWLMTALGRAYLAYCPANERQRIVAHVISTSPTDVKSVFDAIDPARHVFVSVVAEYDQWLLATHLRPAITGGDEFCLGQTAAPLCG